MAQTTPSQPQRDSGRPSTSTTTSSIRSRSAFSTRRLVERPVARDDRRRRGVTVDVEGHAAPRRVPAARDHPVDDGRRGRRGSASARKPTWPRLTPSSGDAGAAGRARRRAGACRRRRARRPARSPRRPRSTSRRRRSAPGSVERRRLVLRAPGPRCPPRAAAARDRAALARRLAPAGVRHEEDATRRGAHCSSRSLLDRPARARAGVERRRAARAATGSTRRCRPAPAAGWPSRRATPSPRSAAARRRTRTASARSAGSRTTPPGAEPLAADLELRLDHQHAGRRPARRTRTSAGSTSAQRDERQVGDDQVDRPTGIAPGSGRGRWCGRAP